MPPTMLIDCPFYIISRLTLQVTSALKKGFSESGIESVRPAYLGVLFCLWHEDNRKVIDLGRCVRLEPSSMTGLIDRMERDGLVCRQPDPGDRRANRIHLTEKGRSVMAPARIVTQQTLDRVFKGIPAGELEQTMILLKKVLTNLGDEETG